MRNSTGHQPAVGPAFRPSNGAHLFFCSSRLRHALAMEDHRGLSSDSGIHWDVHRGRACACGERGEAWGNPSPRGRPGRCFAGRRPPACRRDTGNGAGHARVESKVGSARRSATALAPSPAVRPSAESRSSSPSEPAARACMLLARLPPAVAAASLRVGKTCKGVGKSWCLHDRS